MYGYVCICKPELRFREYDVYHSCYCGLCQALKEHYGTFARWMVSYDMTFLILLLNGLYEPEELVTSHRCAAHPFRKQQQIRCDITDYAADISVLLFRDKCMDDWNDEHKLSRRTLAGLLHKGYQKVQKLYPEKVHVVQEQLKKLEQMEQENESNPDLPAGCFGTLLSELFLWKKDEWEETLRNLGFYLGKFIYLLDAYDDLERDKKKHCYNPLSHLEAEDPQFDDTCHQLLQMMMANCAESFERLPILHNVEILRNILYAGVWTKFNQAKKKRQEEKIRQHRTKNI